MSKGKNASVEKKKAPQTGPGKAPSAYQSGKSSHSNIDIISVAKKKK